MTDHPFFFPNAGKKRPIKVPTPSESEGLTAHGEATPPASTSAPPSEPRRDPGPVDRLLAVPPHNPDAEVATLGSVLLDNAQLATVRTLVRPADFYFEAHRVFFRAMLACADDGDPVDYLTLLERLEHKRAVDDEVIVYLTGLVHRVPSARVAPYYASIVRKNAMLRAIIRAAQRIERAAYEFAGDFDAFRGACVKSMERATRDWSKPGPKTREHEVNP